MPDIVETAASAGNFRTLVTAIRAAGLSEALQGSGPFTIFAPTDDAFNQLDPETRERLFRDPPRLNVLLSYHVLPNRVRGSDAIVMTHDGNVAEVPTILGVPVRVRREGVTARELHVNDATVVVPHIEASNGIIHGIDRVILPP